MRAAMVVIAGLTLVALTGCEVTAPLPGPVAEIRVFGSVTEREYLSGDNVPYEDRVLIVHGEVTDTDPLNAPDSWDGRALVLRSKTERYILSDIDLHPVEDEDHRWSFERRVRLRNGFNSLEIHVAAFPGGVVLERSEVINLRGDWGAGREYVIFSLEWNDVDHANLGLFVEDDLGNVCSEDDPNVGGMVLDIGDSYGFGPEYITATNPRAATYTVRVRYRASNGHQGPVPCRVRVYVNGAEQPQSPYTHTFYPDDVGGDYWHVVDVNYNK